MQIRTARRSDPRTPKQIKKKTSFKTVEGYARFTVKEMQEKLEQKKHGECTCKPKDIALQDDVRHPPRSGRKRREARRDALIFKAV